MIILGVNAHHGDASAALIIDGKVVAAVEDERFTRIKHSAGFPAQAIQFCLAHAGVRLRDIDHVAVARDPWSQWPQKLRYGLRLPRFAIDRGRVAARFAGTAHAICDAVDGDRAEWRARIHRIEHHRAHCASAYYTSATDRALVLSLDGMGDFSSGAWGLAEGIQIGPLHHVAFPHSLGVLYTALTQYLGFWQYGDEYKVMGLAAHGVPSVLDKVRYLVQSDERHGYRLALQYFTHHRDGVATQWQHGQPAIGRLYSPALESLLGPSRRPDAEITERHVNVAASVQELVATLITTLVRRLTSQHQSTELAYGGGVAFNCVANARILSDTPVTTLHLHPAAGDAGLAVGAAFAVWHERLRQSQRFVLTNSFWGPSYSDADIAKALDSLTMSYERYEPATLVLEVARAIADGQVAGWFQGRAEWGPRALGARSLLADPRNPRMPEILNGKVKLRESFRPFAPSILAERATDWFDCGHASPFMSLAVSVRPEQRNRIPAVVHVDGTARMQTVARDHNPLFWELLSAFDALTGVPMLLNTSFNENEPIVNSPQQAIACFARTSIDVMAIGSYLVRRPQQA